eukprot:m51a1_g7356 hypothetical protein (263) ;mRNA; f:31528-32382
MLDVLSLAIVVAHCALNGALYRMTGSHFHTVGIVDLVLSLASTAVALAVLAWGPEGAPLSYAILERPIAVHCWWFVVQLPGFLLLKQQYIRDSTPATWRFMITHHSCVAAFGVILYLFPCTASFATGDITPYAFFYLWQGGNGFAYPLYCLIRSEAIGQRTAARTKLVLQRLARWGSYVALLWWPESFQSLYPWLFGAAHLTFEVLCVRSAWRSLWRPDRPRRPASPEPCACPVVECQHRKVPSAAAGAGQLAHQAHPALAN